MLKTQLDQFTTAYIEAALWSSTDDGEPLDALYGLDDIAPQTLAAMIADCQAFQAAHWDDIADNLSLAGHDFWLTRCGHGAGYWDGDWPESGERLTAASHAFDNVDLYVSDDGKVWA
jgi:hypothetical protein